jgi:nucleoside phosphorylase
MILIVIATKIEADELITFYKLKINNSFSFEIYQNDTISLIISKMNHTNSAIATTYAFCNIKNISHVFNIGIAGCNNKDIQIGDIFLINKIHDTIYKNDLYPDILLTHNLQETQLSTFSNIVLKNQTDIQTPLVDMEASGFFASSLNFINVENISIIKIVSDYLLDSEKQIFSKQFVKNLMKKNIVLIDDFLKNYIIKQKKLLDENDIKKIKEIKENKKLSFCNQHIEIQNIKYQKAKALK